MRFLSKWRVETLEQCRKMTEKKFGKMTDEQWIEYVFKVLGRPPEETNDNNQREPE